MEKLRNGIFLEFVLVRGCFSLEMAKYHIFDAFSPNSSFDELRSFHSFHCNIETSCIVFYYIQSIVASLRKIAFVWKELSFNSITQAKMVSPFECVIYVWGSSLKATRPLDKIETIWRSCCSFWSLVDANGRHSV